MSIESRRSTIQQWLALSCFLLLFSRSSYAQSELQIAYGSQGLDKLVYRGQTLEDVSRFPDDAFHIWHMKSTDLSGRVLTQGQNGWGEAKTKRTWDSSSHTWTYQFQWGSIAFQYVQHGNTLDMNVTEMNRPGSGIRFLGASIYPLALHFPQLPEGFANPGYNQLATNTTGPSITLASYGTAEVAAVVTNATQPLYSGFEPVHASGTYTALISSTSPDSLAAFEPHRDRVIAPGQSDRFTVSLRFAPAGTPKRALAADAYTAWATAWPMRLNWPDRRIVGTAFLASSAQGDKSRPAGYPANPRRYFNAASSSDVDVRTPAGLKHFQERILRKAGEIVTNLRKLHAQGLITWDIEGEQYPMDTSYVCSPDQIAAVAPEMESVISDSGSPFRGTKLDDAYFRIIRDAGFRVGVCVRPQNFTLSSDGTAHQTTLPKDADITALLIHKMRYAHDRWGATLFYIDSTVDALGAPLDASIFQQAAAALPDSLLIPEESTPKYYAYTAPFRTFLFHGDLGTDPAIYNMYPSAFSANLVNDVSPNTLALHRAELTESVKRGDILMVHADSWHPDNDTVIRMYQDAGRRNAVTATDPNRHNVQAPHQP